MRHLIPISMLPPEILSLLLWSIMPIIYPPWFYPGGFFYSVFFLGLLGIEIAFLIGAIRRMMDEFRNPMRIWWKILFRILLAIGVVVFVGFTLMFLVWGFLA